MALEKDIQNQKTRTNSPGAATQSAPEKAPAVEEQQPAKFDPAVILGTSDAGLAMVYATAAVKLLGGPAPMQTATRVKAVRFLTIALEFLK